jgi:hypothetical protein
MNIIASDYCSLDQAIRPLGSGITLLLYGARLLNVDLHQYVWFLPRRDDGSSRCPRQDDAHGGQRWSQHHGRRRLTQSRDDSADDPCRAHG